MILLADQGCGPVILIAGIAAVLSMVAWAAKTQNQTRRQFLARIGGKWNGRVIEGSFLDNPRLEIDVEGVAGQLTYYAGSRHQAAWTKMQFNCSSPHRLRMHPEGFTSFMRSIFGGTDLEIGDPEFDGTFWVEATDRAWARTVLTPRIRRRLMELRGTGTWFTSNDVSVDLGPAGLVLKVSRNLVDDESYVLSFVDLAVLILSEIRGVGAVAGIVIADVEVKSGSECPVCGHGVEDAAKVCPQCRTPHHADCWKYMGGCAIFACAGRGSRAA